MGLHSRSRGASGRAGRHRRRRARTLALIVAIGVVATSACGGSSHGSPGSSAGAAGSASKATLEYGLGPQKNDKVKFQPDVVIVAGGPDSIRSVTDSGLTWVIDGSAAGVDDLRPGKIMFVTGRAVGRVLAISAEGRDRKVIIGPVSVTDVIRDGNFEQSGISLQNAYENKATGTNFESSDSSKPGTSARTTPAGAGRGAKLTAAHRPGARARLMAASGAGCCSSISAPVNYNQGGVRFYGTAELNIDKPGATFNLDISGGGIKHAELKVTGGMSLHVDFAAGVDQGAGSRTFEVPLGSDFSVPLGWVIGVPLSVTVHQFLRITTAFAAKVGTIKGNGTFSLGSVLGFSYNGSAFTNENKVDFKRQVSLINSLHGVPIGVMGLVMDHLIKFTVGFGAFVLSAGVYALIDTKFGATLGSGLGAPLAVCRGVGLGVFASFGIGYTINETVTKYINKFLSLFNVKPIKREGGIRSPIAELYKNEEVVPDVKVCGHAGEAGGSQSAAG